MPIKPLDAQRRTRESGRIRLGTRVMKNTRSGPRLVPERLSTFRLTSRDRRAIERAAELWGGEAQPWKDGPTADQWEVTTTTNELPVIVPARAVGVDPDVPDGVMSQWMEMWAGGGCARRCDGEREQMQGVPCLCPADAAERDRLAARGEACKPVTRVNFVLPDLPGGGLLRVEPHGWNAAHEMPAMAAALAEVRARGGRIPAVLRLEQRKTVRNGETSHYVVPVLDILHSLRELETMDPRELSRMLPPAPAAVAAIGAGPSAPARPDPRVVQAPAAWTDEEPPPDDAPPLEERQAPASARQGVQPAAEAPESPEAVARAAHAATRADDVLALWRLAEAKGWLDDHAPESAADDAPWTELRHVLTAIGERLRRQEARRG